MELNPAVKLETVAGIEPADAGGANTSAFLLGYTVLFGEDGGTRTHKTSTVGG